MQHLRNDAGLTGKDLSARRGWHPAKTTRIQKGAVLPWDEDIRTWCAACGADDLMATAHAVDSMYMEWRRLYRNGTRKVQQDWNTARADPYLPGLCLQCAPGLFQTAGFATALMEQITRFQGAPDDVAEAVAARIAIPACPHPPFRNNL